MSLVDKRTTSIISNDLKGKEFRIYLHYMNYSYFILEIDKIKNYTTPVENLYTGFNPIIIFNGISWNNIVYLFKLKEIDLHGEVLLDGRNYLL